MTDLLHNNPPVGIDLFKERFDAFIKEAGEVQTVDEGNASQVRDVIGSGSELAKEIEKQRKGDKQPHLDASRAIDAAYRPVTDEVSSAVKQLKGLLGKFLADQERIARDKAQEEARKLREAEEAAEQVEDDPFLAATADVSEAASDITLATEKARLAEMEAKAASRIPSETGGFRATGLKTKRVAVVTDAAALAQHYVERGNTDLIALLERLANADVRHAKGGPVNLPGVLVEEERVLS